MSSDRQFELLAVVLELSADVRVEANEVIDGGVTGAGLEGAGHVHKVVGNSTLRLCRLRHNTAMDDITLRTMRSAAFASVTERAFSAG
jgi:hypothetical protein